MSDTLFRTRTKATDREGERIRSSLNWLVARRAELVVGPDGLTCGDWRLPYAEFESATLVTIPTRLGDARTLIVRCRGRAYQFQLPTQSVWRMAVHPFWDGPLPFPVVREVRWPEPPSGWLLVIGIAAAAAGLALPLLRL
jgi:hypothetical protein